MRSTAAMPLHPVSLRRWRPVGAAYGVPTSSFSKWPRAFLMLISVAAEGMLGSDMMTMTYVLGVNWSMKDANFSLRTSMLSNCAVILLQLSLNCLMMLLIFSKRCGSRGFVPPPFALEM